MRFTAFLRTSVLLFAGAATALAAVAVAGARYRDDTTLLYVAVGWWVLGAIGGLWLGRRRETTHGTGRLLTAARHSPTLPELEPGRTVVNRLWPLIIVTAAAAGIAVLIPQGRGMGAGYALIMALSWRRQARAFAAIEDGDGVRFSAERSSALKPMQLLR